ncbi:MAG: protein translocase subunit SecF [Patescibacteria group bacterium]
MWVVKHRKIFYTFSLLLVAACIVSLFVWGVKPGIDFTGGTLVEVSYPGGRPDQDAIAAQLSAIDSAASIRPAGEDGYIVRMKAIDQTEKAQVMEALSLKGSTQLVEKTFDSIGPVLGVEALRKSMVSIVLVILAIVLFITFAFRKVSEPVSSWKYGLTAIIALIHDVVIPIGAFSVLGHFLGYEVDTLFVTALLVVLGFSVHDTIVVFDRVRENLKHGTGKKSFEHVVGESIGQTFTRSINTSLTTLLALIVLYFVGGDTTRHFSLALIIGIAAGTYSSVFVGSPLLVTIQQWSAKRKGGK